MWVLMGAGLGWAGLAIDKQSRVLFFPGRERRFGSHGEATRRPACLHSQTHHVLVPSPHVPQVRASDVVLPEGAVFVVANSLAVSNKAESATKHYNLRVVECRWAWLALGCVYMQCREGVLACPGLGSCA